MPFDIYALDKLDWEDDDREAVVEEYQDTLVQLFLDSAEGRAQAKEDEEIGFWARRFVGFGYTYLGVTPPQMDTDDASEIMENVFPRKISLLSPDDADNTIPELTAFWQYLKREYHLPNAEGILHYLRQIEPQFIDIMNDPARFGMAKSFIMQGQAMGFDMTDKKQIDAFMNAYNAALLAGETEPLPLPTELDAPGPPSGASRSSKTKKSKRKKKKPRAQVSRRQRKKKKRR